MLEFLEEEHIYLYEGVIIPSVSEILKFLFPNKYEGIPNAVLNEKADYGTKIHGAIELLEKTGEVIELNYIQTSSIEQYIKLKQKYSIEVLEQEQMIHYQDKYAGRFDMLATINDELSLCDIKTTATLDREYLSWQLSLYAFAYECLQTDSKIKSLYAIWLPKKELGQVVKVDRKSNEEILKLIERYEKNGHK